MKDSRRMHGMMSLSALLFIALPIHAQPQADLQGLLKGVQDREQRLTTVAGRILYGLRIMKLGMGEPLSSVDLVDFACTPSAYRSESRMIVNAGIMGLGYDALFDENADLTKIETNRLYTSKIYDGKVLYTYDRSTNTSRVNPLTDPSVPDWMREMQKSGSGTVRYAFGSPDRAIVGRMLEGKLATTATGPVDLDGHRCYIVTGVSTKPAGEPRGYFRMWVAPDADFGVLRSEHIEADKEGRASSCSVIRTSGWAKKEALGMWVPEVYQSDMFYYGRLSALLKWPLGWHESRLIVALQLTTDPQAVAAAVPYRFPFDCAVIDSITHERQDDPAQWPQELTPLLQYRAPDALGLDLLANSDVGRLFGE